MCRRVDCSNCGRPSYAGCGAHIEQVLAEVPQGERCRCREMQAQKSVNAELAKPSRERTSWVRRLIG